jgi:hypothetical protein
VASDQRCVRSADSPTTVSADALHTETLDQFFLEVPQAVGAAARLQPPAEPVLLTTFPERPLPDGMERFNSEQIVDKAECLMCTEISFYLAV